MSRMEEKKQRIEYLSYIIGIIGFMMLGHLIGSNGIVYMAVMIECISLFVVLTNGLGADLTGKMLRSRRKKNQYLDAVLLHKTLFILQTIFAVVGAVVYFFVSDILAEKVFGIPFLGNVLKVLTPIILFKTWQCIILGYFQGIGSNMPTVVCSVFRQLLFLLFSLLFANRLVEYGTKVSGLLYNPDFTGMYGALGLCLAMVLAEILISLFLLIVYIGSDRKREQKKADDGFRKTNSLGGRIRVIFAAFIPETGKQLLKKLPFAVVLFLFLKSAGENTSEAVPSYGIFFTSVVCFGAVFVLFLCVRMLGVLSHLTSAIRRKDNRAVRDTIYAGLHYCWIAGLYFGICMAVLAPSLSKFLGGEAADQLEQYYAYGAGILLITVLNVFLFRVIWILGSKNMSYIILTVFNVVLLICGWFLTGKNENAILALCQSVLIAGVVQLFVSFFYTVRKYVLQPDIIHGVLLPLIGAVGMGLAIIFVQRGLSPHVGTFMCLLLCAVIGWIVYFAILLMTGCLKESKIMYLYGDVGRRFLGLFIR